MVRLVGFTRLDGCTLRTILFVFVESVGVNWAGRGLAGTAESPHAGLDEFTAPDSFAGATFGTTVRLRVEGFRLSGGAGLVIRGLICVWAAAVGTARKRKRKTREVFFIATLNSTSTAVHSSGNDGELRTHLGDGLVNVGK